MPSRKRKAISDHRSQANVQAREKITNSHRSTRKILLRPTRSPSGPSRAAPNMAPTMAAAESRPRSVVLPPRSLAMSGLATPMMKKSNPSSITPRAATSQNRRCTGVMDAWSSATPRGSGVRESPLVTTCAE